MFIDVSPPLNAPSTINQYGHSTQRPHEQSLQKNAHAIDETQRSVISPTQKSMQDEEDQTLHKHTHRITYGLKVLELMSEEEYQAFLWASEGMNEMEIMLMAQSLYRFTAFYQGKNTQNTAENALLENEPKSQYTAFHAQKLQAQRAFGVEQKNINDFINRYKNAYDKLLESQHYAQLTAQALKQNT